MKIRNEFFWRFGASLSIWFWFGAGAYAQSCDLNGKALVFVGKNCIKGNCDIVRHKIMWLGGKILFFDKPDTPNGIVFIENKSVELPPGTYSERYQPGRNENAIRMVATATTIWKDNSLSMVAHGQWFTQSDRLTMDWKQSLVIEFPGCNTCTVRSYELSLTAPEANGEMRQVKSDFQMYSCRYL